jgi:zinc-ribbon domain
MRYGELCPDLNRVLKLIDDPPNLRNDPADPTGTTRLFDGGRMIIITGLTRYEFTDGTTASTGVYPGSPLQISFPDGWEVSVKLTRKFCIHCGLSLRRSAKFCPGCGARACTPPAQHHS